MFQQFMDFEQTVRYAPDPLTAPVSMEGMDKLIITSDVIQGEFDIIAHDGTLPGTDGKKVAALSFDSLSQLRRSHKCLRLHPETSTKKLILAAAKSMAWTGTVSVHDEQSIAAAGPVSRCFKVSRLSYALSVSHSASGSCGGLPQSRLLRLQAFQIWDQSSPIRRLSKRA